MTNWTIRFFAVIFVLLSGIACSYLFAQQDTKGETIDDEDMGVVSFEEMNYPTIARAARREGVVVVRVKLDEKGKVLAAFAISGSKMLVPESISNVEKWRFRPNPARSAVVLYEIGRASCRERV